MAKAVRINVTETFKFAEGGIDVKEYRPGEHDVSARCAEVALENKWAEKMKTPVIKNKMLKSAPKNKAGKG